MITLQNYKVVITMLCQTREDGVSSRHTLVPFLRKLFIAFLDFLQNILNDQTGNGKSENGGGVGYRTVGVYLSRMPIVFCLIFISQ